MASTDMRKMTMAAAVGMRVHLDSELREKLQHENRHIDKNKSSQNSVLGCSSYKECLNSLKKRTAAVDAVKPPKRVKKDRVVAISMVTPCPRELTEKGQSEAFFTMLHDFLKEKVGSENVHGVFVHRDEIHDYIDKNGTKKTSLEHAHAIISPYTEEHGINGKAFMTRQWMQDFHREFADRVREDFGIEYMTGETPGRESVEQLKTASAIKESRQARMELHGIQNDVSIFTDVLKDIKKDIAAAEKLLEQQNKLLQEQGKKLQEQERVRQEQIEAGQKLRASFERLKAELSDEEGYKQRATAEYEREHRAKYMGFTEQLRQDAKKHADASWKKYELQLQGRSAELYREVKSYVR